MENTAFLFTQGVRRLFSALYPNSAAQYSPPVAAPEPGLPASSAHQARSKLIAAIGAFFLDHDLHLSGPRLLLVHDMLAGGHADLRAQLDARLASPLGVNDAWLESVEYEQALRNSASLDRLAGEFETQLGMFRANTRNAREAAESYGDELAVQIETDLGDYNATSALAALAEKMLDQSRRLTATIKGNEQDSEKLQRQLEQARLEAQTDQLTGLPNRRAFEDQFRRYCDLARAQRQPLCLAFCDIDNFKQVNDRHGHETGDRVLRVVADVLGSLSKSGSFVSRHGGEEFVLLFSGVPLDKAARRLDAARAQLAAKQLVGRDSGLALGRVSFSAGIVNVMAFANPREGLHAADAALYRAKHAGKNQVLSA